MSDLAIKLNLNAEELPRFETLEEVRVSLLQRADKWTQQWLDEGREEGLEKGREEGNRLGMAKVLKQQLQHRFGDLPNWAKDTVDRADVDTLQSWAFRVLEATTLEDALQENDQG